MSAIKLTSADFKNKVADITKEWKFLGNKPAIIDFYASWCSPCQRMMPTVHSFAASFGATIGQNGCAGLYPAMLAVMVAPTVGINPLDPVWIATLVAIVTLSSAGVAGVGGGATFAALIVLPAMGLPVSLVALLIPVEPLIDMCRTALNVSGAMVAGTVTSQILHQTDKAILAEDDHGDLAHA